MNQPKSSFPLPPGVLRPAALGLMVLGAGGFLVATVWYQEQVVWQLVATMVVFAGLGLVLLARRQAAGGMGSESQRQPNRDVAEQDLKSNLARGAGGLNEPALRPAPLNEVVPETERASLGGLAGEVLVIYERKGAYVRVEASRPGRSVVRANLVDGMRVTVLVLEGQDEVDLAEVRGLFALVNEQSSAKGYLATRGTFSERARAWADTRGLKLLSQDELWKLGIG